MPVFENFFGSNLLENPDFEGNNTNYWTAAGGVVKNIDSVNFKAGLYSMKLTDTIAGDVGAYSNKVKVSPGDVVVYGGYFRRNNLQVDVKLDLYCYGYTGRVNVTIVENAFTVDPGWVYKEFRAVIPASVGQVMVMVQMTGANVGNAINIDEMFIIIERQSVLDLNKRIIQHVPHIQVVAQYTVAVSGINSMNFSCSSGKIWKINFLSAFDDTSNGVTMQFRHVVAGVHYSIIIKNTFLLRDSLQFYDYSILGGEGITVFFFNATVGDFLYFTIGYEELDYRAS